MSFEVRLRKNEDTETLIKRFVKKTKKMRLMEEIYERSYYKKPSVLRREEFFRRRALLKRLRKKQERYNRD